ncbi:hypothetical protein [Sphingomonas sp.]|uniref:hypothetical protein n=1 Tax=Sphingomonas sp. TaxID=28214 RepID=UPI002CF03BB1|nr:hypothetical protein [Sphingomonas sp.]HTG37373.1 hypothetical protein [Sphingomonas sp.]
MKYPATILGLTIVLAACGQPATPAADDEARAAENRAGLAGNVVELPAGEGEGEAAGAPANAVARADSWIGRWRGVEGLNLVIEAGDAPGRYRLDMQYSLDDKGVFDGIATAEGIMFSRPDGEHVLRAGDGQATGLKWLADKQNCLVVKPGEGYCRD